MKTYNRALDYAVLAMTELKAGNGVLAARLLAKAIAQNDCDAAIATIEASNRHAFALTASKRLRANEIDGEDEVDSDDDVDAEEVAAKRKTLAKRKALKADADEMDAEDDIDAGVEDEDFGEDDDPLAEVADADTMEEDKEEEPGQAMAKVLSRMVRRSGRK